MLLSYAFFVDARVDGMQWINKGSIRLPTASPFRQSKYRKTTCVARGGTGGFYKEVWEELKVKSGVPQIIVVIYGGVESDFDILPHGNSLSDRKFFRTPKSNLSALKRSENTPKITYINECLDGEYYSY